MNKYIEVKLKSKIEKRVLIQAEDIRNVFLSKNDCVIEFKDTSRNSLWCRPNEYEKVKKIIMEEK